MRRALRVSPCPVVPVGTMGESLEATLRVRGSGGEQPPAERIPRICGNIAALSEQHAVKHLIYCVNNSCVFSCNKASRPMRPAFCGKKVVLDGRFRMMLVRLASKRSC